MKRVYNFSAGPCALPLEVLRQAQSEMLDYRGTGMSVMEMSHRSSAYQDIIDTTEHDLREVMNIPKTYSVLFLQGGASLQFSMVPINLMKTGKADYIDSGEWSKKAIKEAKKVGEVRVIASSAQQKYMEFPRVTSDMVQEDADYVYITTNNTIYGTRAYAVPDTKGVPLVADMSSNILSEKMNVEDYGLIFAGAQKNMGPAGVTIVIVRNDLLGGAPKQAPTMLDYKIHADKGSMYNTPPAYAIYVMGLVLQWMKKNGGIDALERQNIEKAHMLYQAIDRSTLFTAPVDERSRSRMNVVFVTGNEKLDKLFVEQAECEGLVSLAGHRNVGGLRASLYNAMSRQGVEQLVRFIEKFDRTHA